jgi:hypothetical protein
MLAFLPFLATLLAFTSTTHGVRADDMVPFELNVQSSFTLSQAVTELTAEQQDFIDGCAVDSFNSVHDPAEFALTESTITEIDITPESMLYLRVPQKLKTHGLYDIQPSLRLSGDRCRRCNTDPVRLSYAHADWEAAFCTCLNGNAAFPIFYQDATNCQIIEPPTMDDKAVNALPEDDTMEDKAIDAVPKDDVMEDKAGDALSQVDDMVAFDMYVKASFHLPHAVTDFTDIEKDFINMCVLKSFNDTHDPVEYAAVEGIISQIVVIPENMIHLRVPDLKTQGLYDIQPSLRLSGDRCRRCKPDPTYALRASNQEKVGYAHPNWGVEYCKCLRTGSATFQGVGPCDIVDEDAMGISDQ